MAVTLTGRTGVDRITLSATQPQATQVNLPESCRSISINFVSNAGRFAYSGSDGVALSDDYISIPSDTPTPVAIAGRARVLGGQTIYLASGTNSTVVEIEWSDVVL